MKQYICSTVRKELSIEVLVVKKRYNYQQYCCVRLCAKTQKFFFNLDNGDDVDSLQYG